MTNMPFESIDQVDAVDSKRLYKGCLRKVRQEKKHWISFVKQRETTGTPMQWTSEQYAGFLHMNLG